MTRELADRSVRVTIFVCIGRRKSAADIPDSFVSKREGGTIVFAAGEVRDREAVRVALE